MKAILFGFMYIHAVVRTIGRRLFKGRAEVPEGIRGTVMLKFVDPDFPGKQHSVVAFILPPKTQTEQLGELYGPFGYSSQTRFMFWYVYHRDTWGIVSEDQIAANPVLQGLCAPGELILLAGVRGSRRGFVWPLNNPEHFILAWK